MDGTTIIEAIIFLKGKGIITDNDIEKVRNGKMTLDELCQIASKRYFNICYLQKTIEVERGIKIIDLRGEKDILEDEIMEKKDFIPTTGAINLSLDLSVYRYY